MRGCDRRSAPRWGPDRRAVARKWRGIDPERLFIALENVARGRGLIGYLSSREQENLVGILVKDWGPRPALTKLGWAIHDKLKMQFIVSVHAH